MATDKRSDDSGSDGRSASITRRPFLRSLAGAGALGVPAISTSAVASPSGQLWAGGSGVNIDYNNCGVASVTRASEVESLAIYYADADGERQLRSGVDPTTGDQHQYRPIIVEHSSGSDKTKIQITGSGGPLVHIVADLYSGGRTAKSNSDACFPEGFNSKPAVSFAAETDDTDPTSGSIQVDVGERVTFRSDAKDPDEPEERLRYEWDFDGTGFVENFGEETEYTYENAGSYEVRLRVTDDFDASSTASLDLTVRAPANWTQGQMLEQNDPLMFSEFGNSVALTGDAFVVGAKFERLDGDTLAAGAVYVYDQPDDPTVSTKIVSDNPSQEAQFGTSVATSGGTVVIGSTKGVTGEGDNKVNNSGSAYLYEVGDDPESLTGLVPTGLSEEDRFGVSVAVSNASVVVGAPNTDDVGAVYEFDHNGDSITPTGFVPSIVDDGAQFGASVAVSDGSVVVGAPYHGAGGAAYVYEFGEESSGVTELIPSGLAADGEFGSSVAISGGTIVVGAPFDDKFETDAGAVYVYDAADLSSPMSVLAPSDPTGGVQFGDAVAVSGGTVVVGAPKADNSGVAYVYDLKAGPAPVTTLAPEDPTGIERFGDAVAVSGGTAVVGAPLSKNGSEWEAGVAYVFER